VFVLVKDARSRTAGLVALNAANCINHAPELNVADTE